MARVKKEIISEYGKGKRNNKIIFETVINVNSEGLFTTTIPPGIASQLESANIDLRANQKGNKGFFQASTYNGLIDQIREKLREYLHRELESEKIVILYEINTICSYSYDSEGNIIPNHGAQWTSQKDAIPYAGNVQIDQRTSQPFGFTMFARPYMKKIFIKKNGEKETEYERLVHSSFGEPSPEKGYYLAWLDDVHVINHSKRYLTELSEIDYDEGVAKFFVDLIKSIININEKVKGKLKPDYIKHLAASNQKLLK